MKKLFTTLNRQLALTALVLSAGSLHSNAQDVSLTWATQISGTGGSIVTSSMTLDQNNDLFAVGIFLDSIEVPTINGNVKLISQGASDMYIAKLNTDGKIIWIKSVGGPGEMGSPGTSSPTEDLYQEPFFSIVSDPNGNVYITGYYKDSVDFDPGPGRVIRGSSKAATPNSFILSLDNDGGFRWVKTLFGANNYSNDIAIDKENGTLYITGSFTDKVDFDDGTGLHIVSPTKVGRGFQDIFIAKYDTKGTFIWAHPYGNGDRPSTDEGLAIHVGAKGNVYTTGYYRDSLSFDQNNPNAYILNPSSNANIFVLKTNADGKYIWARDMGGYAGSGHCRGQGITTDREGNVYTTGYFQGAATFDPQNRTPVPAIYGNGITFFLSKLDSAGVYVWAKIFERPTGKNSADNGLSVAVDDSDNVYAAGYFGSEIYLDPDVNKPNRELFIAKDGSNALIVKLAPDGNYIWGKQFNNAPQVGHTRGLTLLTNSGDVYVGGYFSATSDFDPSDSTYNLTSANSYDGYVVKLSCPGSEEDVTVKICGDSYRSNGVVYDKDGIYTEAYKNVSGCDSIVTLHLTLNAVPNAVINVNGFTLGTAGTYQTYQWLLNDNIIPGATSDTYRVTQNGAYKVVVSTDKGCIDTSDAYIVKNYTGIDRPGLSAEHIHIYPNPTNDIIYISTPVKVNVALTDMAGRTIRRADHAQKMSLKDVVPGLYLLQVTDDNGLPLKTVKILRQDEASRP